MRNTNKSIQTINLSYPDIRCILDHYKLYTKSLTVPVLFKVLIKKKVVHNYILCVIVIDHFQQSTMTMEHIHSPFPIIKVKIPHTYIYFRKLRRVSITFSKLATIPIFYYFLEIHMFTCLLITASNGNLLVTQ